MVKLDKIYTRGGDKGQTSLGDGARVPKYHLRIEAIGTVDEANACIGLARLYASSSLISVLSDIQHDLFDVGADLCMPHKEAPKKEALRIQVTQVDRLEQTIDHYNEHLKPLQSFILPGGSPPSAHLHLARTVVRRAERLLTHLQETETVNNHCIQYLNRLSDLLFVLCRHCNDQGKTDILWQPGKTI